MTSIITNIVVGVISEFLAGLILYFVVNRIEKNK